MTEEALKAIKCKVNACKKLIKNNGKYCSMHRARLERTGRLTLKTYKEKLLNKIEIEIDKKTQCWNWTGYKNELGYGRFRMNGIKTLVHRASFKIFKGGFPKEMLICHSCDNPSCINPDHLFIGTHQDNVRDAMKKGRFWSTQNV